MQIIFNLIILYSLLHFTFKWNNNIIHRSTNAHKYNYLNGILWGGIAIKISVICAWYLIAGGQEFNPSVDDSAVYDSIGTYIGDSLRNFVLPSLSEHDRMGFACIMGMLYAIFGNYHIVISLYNALLSVWMAMMIFEITYKIGKNYQAGIYAYIAALFYPHFVSASYLLLKDMTATFLLVAVLWALYCVEKTKTKLILLSITIFILAYVRIQMAGIAIVLSLITVTLRRDIIFEKWPIKNNFINYFIVILLIVSIGTGFWLSDINMAQISLEEKGYTLPDSNEGGVMPQEDIRITMTGEGFANVLIYIAAKPVLLIRSLVATFIRIFFGPFFLLAAEGVNLTPYAPNEVGFRAVLESLGGLYTGLILPYIIFGFLYFMRKHRRDVFIWIFPILWVFIMTLVTPIIRWRLPMIALTFILFGMGFQFSSRINRYFPLYFIMLIFALAFNASRLEGFFLVVALFAAVIAFIIQWLVLKDR
jgi:hypothetical protein